MLGTLLIYLEKAHLSHNTDLIKSMDPFVEIKHLDQITRSQIKNGAGKNPVWKETLTIQVKENEIILFNVFDSDILKNDLIGTGAYELKNAKEFMQNPNTKEKIQLYVHSSNYAGELLISLSFFPNPNVYIKLNEEIQKEIKLKDEEITQMKKELKITNKLERLDQEIKGRKKDIVNSILATKRKEHLNEEIAILKEELLKKIESLNKKIENLEGVNIHYQKSLEKFNETIITIEDKLILCREMQTCSKVKVTVKDGYFFKLPSRLGINPYVIFTTAIQTQKTQILKDAGSSPTFNETFIIEKKELDHKIYVEVLDHCKIGDPNCIGNGILNLNLEVIKGGKQNFQVEIYDFEKATGYINVEIDFSREF